MQSGLNAGKTTILFCIEVHHSANMRFLVIFLERAASNPFQSSEFKSVFEWFSFINMVREDKRKKRSQKKRKRRRFYGVRPQEKRDDLRTELSDMTTDPSTMPASDDTSAPITAASVESISSKKLLNTSFERFESDSHSRGETSRFGTVARRRNC